MKHQSKPLIEEHYHIQELIDRQENRTEDRNYHRSKEKDREERTNLIKDAKDVEVTDFWCHSCKKDFTTISVKQIEIDWSNSAQNIAFYKTKHKCGKWCIRLITDKQKDGYWMRSKKVALDRGKYYSDTIQPFQTNFNLLYGKKL